LLIVLTKHIKNNIYNMKKSKKILIVLSLLLIPLFSSAVESVPLPDPLDGVEASGLVANMINGILGVVGALALFFFVWGGVLWMSSGGNTEKVKKGRDSIVWAIFGLLAIFGSYVVLNFVLTDLLAQ